MRVQLNMTFRTPKLSALTSAALAIPGLAHAELQTDYLYSHYEEGDLSAADSASGSASERYTIDSHLFRVGGNLGAGDANLNLTVETMSGASPWWVQPDANGKPVQVMSGASIDEERVDIEASYGRQFGPIEPVFKAGYSSEEDYQSVNVGVEAQYTPEGGVYSASAGIGYSDDRIEPTDGGSAQYPDRIRSADKNSLTAYAGLSWIIDAQTVLQTVFSYSLHDGYLTDPYKRAYFVSVANAVPESRPDGRQSWTLSARWRHYLPALTAAVHVDYRYFQDDWEIESHTLELGWQQRIGETWRVSPSLRWYSQSQAYFYAPYYADFRDDGFASSDYRLSPFGALSARLDVRKSLDQHWEVGGGVEVYDASADYAVRSVGVENPGLVQYYNVQARVSYRF
jgi:hypothetical protein